MNNTLLKLVLLALLLIFICAPFAGFAPLLLAIAIAGISKGVQRSQIGPW